MTTFSNGFFGSTTITNNDENSEILNCLINDSLSKLKEFNYNKLRQYKDSYNNNLLHLAIQFNKNIGVISFLLEIDTSLNEQNIFKQTPEHVAIIYKSFNIIEKIHTFKNLQNINNITNENNKLKNNNSKLQLENKRALKTTNENIELKKLNSTLQNTIKVMTTNNNENLKLNNKIMALTEHNTFLNTKHSNLKREHSNISKENELLITENNNLNKNTKRLNTENYNLKEKNIKMKISVDNLMKLNCVK
jgi:hypothetical protein